MQRKATICAQAMGIDACPELIDSLLTHHPAGASVTTNAGNTALHLACMDREPAYHVVQMLLQDNSDAAATKDKAGKWPLQLCVDSSSDGTANLENVVGVA